MTRRVVVVTAGLSQPSSTRLLADQLADAARTQVSARGESVDIEVIEVRDLMAGLATMMTTGVASREVAAAQASVAAADGLIMVSPVFGGSYAGVFKVFIDALEPGTLDGKPVLIAATAGTPRHSLMLEHAMRPLFAFHRAVVVPTAVFAATEDFGGATGSTLTDRIGRAASELANLVVAVPSAVGGFAAGPRDERPARLAAPTNFAELLRGHAG